MPISTHAVPAAVSPAKASSPVHFASQFGGLWTDRDDAYEILEKRTRRGEIGAWEAERVRFWIENGFVVLPGAATEKAVNAANRAIDSIYQDGTGFIENYETGEHLGIMPVEARHQPLPHKLLDAYAFSPAIRAAAFADPVVEFLNLVFDEPALAFQGLYFEYGSTQTMHQDSAFVRVSRPMELAASWLALEDIQPGSGELEYYAGSHRIKEFLFDGDKKWLPDDHSQYDAFLRYLVDECESRGLRRQLFRPQKGDALIWSADLVHGGSAIKQRATRRSFVTHWCPESAEPAYFQGGFSGRIKPAEAFSYAYSHLGRSQDVYEATARRAEEPEPGFWSRWLH